MSKKFSRNFFTTIFALLVAGMFFSGCTNEKENNGINNENRENENQEVIQKETLSEESKQEIEKIENNEEVNTVFTKENIGDKAALDKERQENQEALQVTTVEEAKAAIESDAEAIAIPKDIWKQLVDAETYHIIAEEGTEAPFTDPGLHNKENGIYVTAGCKQPVFSSDAKFDSGTGWPSFWEPITDDAVMLKSDFRLGYKRWEVVGSRCGEHLGHVFRDGPDPTGLRYCINGAALEFIPEK